MFVEICVVNEMKLGKLFSFYHGLFVQFEMNPSPKHFQQNWWIVKPNFDGVLVTHSRNYLSQTRGQIVKRLGLNVKIFWPPCTSISYPLGEDFFHFSFVPYMFPSSSQWVPIRFPICSLGSQCVAQYRWAKGVEAGGGIHTLKPYQIFASGPAWKTSTCEYIKITE